MSRDERCACGKHVLERWCGTYGDVEGTHRRDVCVPDPPASPAPIGDERPRSPWIAISGKYISIDHGETPQVFRVATDEELELMRQAPVMRDRIEALTAALDVAEKALQRFAVTEERWGERDHFSCDICERTGDSLDDIEHMPDCALTTLRTLREGR